MCCWEMELTICFDDKSFCNSCLLLNSTLKISYIFMIFNINFNEVFLNLNA